MQTLLDRGFAPMSEKMKLLKGAEIVGLAVEGAGIMVKSVSCDTSDSVQLKVIERLVKAMLWIGGGHTVYTDDKTVYEILKKDYSPNGARSFDCDFMQRVFDKPFRVVLGKVPTAKSAAVKLNKSDDGCRIGFDAGGSQRKVSAVIGGVTVFSEAKNWSPKTQTDEKYLLNEIKQAYSEAAAKLPQVDSIGVSTAGIVVDNELMESSLFMKLTKEQKKSLRNVFKDAAKDLGVKVTVANDGDITALSGAREFNCGSLLGISMGTSQAGGYVDSEGNLNGLFNELAFAPIDFSENAALDGWSGDIGCGVKYLSQDGVIKLAEMGGISFNQDDSPSQKIEYMLSTADEMLFKAIYHDIGVYLGYGILFYTEFYDIKKVLILGGVTSGKSGGIIAETARKVLEQRNSDIEILFMEKKNRRVEQASTAASL